MSSEPMKLPINNHRLISCFNGRHGNQCQEGDCKCECHD